ncbi:nitrite reductase putative electron transfer 4fe-s subunit [hydrocarbon metagenome]|uniref:Nitrite reductase putative electron transfer 4fe-s subunit n=1 Tax=hydrocarbon metagenome TaxID=938273 RepID=A0A0W8E6B4_9ZZZZ
MKVISIPEYCLGCGLCEIYCAAQHDGYDGNVLKAYKRGQPAPRSGLIKFSHISWLNTCMNCNDAPCLNACISGAVRRDENGIIYIDENRCVQCYTCVMVCPYGHAQPSGKSGRIIKCDLCRDSSGSPACVSHCPNGALKLLQGGAEQ